MLPQAWEGVWVLGPIPHKDLNKGLDIGKIIYSSMPIIHNVMTLTTWEEMALRWNPGKFALVLCTAHVKSVGLARSLVNINLGTLGTCDWGVNGHKSVWQVHFKRQHPTSSAFVISFQKNIRQPDPPNSMPDAQQQVDVGLLHLQTSCHRYYFFSKQSLSNNGSIRLTACHG